MFELVIRIPERPETIGRLAPGSYRIGSSAACHIQIHLPEVSSRHAMLTVTPEAVNIEDLGSTNGTYVDGLRIRGSAPLDHGSVVRIGNAVLELRQSGRASVPANAPAAANAAPAASAQAPAAASAAPAARGRLPSGDAGTAMLKVSGIAWELRPAVQQFKRQVHEELLKRMNLRNVTLSGANASEVVRQAGDTIRAILTEHRARIPAGVNVELMETELLHEAVSLGPLDPLLKIVEITEIMVNGAQRIYVEKKGRIYRTDLMFADDSQLLTIIERIVAPLGRRIDESQPMVDARLADGSRVNAIIPPLSLEGPILTIRKFAKEVLGVEALIGFGSMTKEMADFLRLCVLVRKNILISGGTGSGKTTLLNILSNFLPNEERIITVEDAAELRLAKEHVVRLESRPQNIEGRGEVAIRDLVRNALRMRPDRIVVGECRGGEALDMLQAMNTGHDGSLTTIHANTARDALSRLETLVLMAGFDLPLRAIREQVASAITVIVQISRCRDGSRKVMDITEVTGMEGEVITTQEIFKFVQEGINEDGTVRGRHVACGIVPTFMQELQEAGLSFNLGIFNEN